MLQKLSEEEAMIDRVWTCFIKLDEPYYSIARALYVEKQPYKYVEQESGFSHRAFEERRRQAIKSIEVMYEKG